MSEPRKAFADLASTGVHLSEIASWPEPSWLDRNYRALMIAAMGLELALLAALVVMEALWHR